MISLGKLSCEKLPCENVGFSKSAYKHLLDKIIAEGFTDELLAYKVAGEAITDQLFSDGGLSTASAKDRDREFGFVEEAKDIVEFLSVMLGTFKLLKQIVTAIRASSMPSPSPITFGESWRRELVEAGLSDNKAEMLVRRFLSDLNGVLNEPIKVATDD